MAYGKLQCHPVKHNKLAREERKRLKSHEYATCATRFLIIEIPFLQANSGADFHQNVSVRAVAKSFQPHFSHLGTLRAWQMRRWLFCDRVACSPERKMASEIDF
jgi:hypothetical protein